MTTLVSAMVTTISAVIVAVVSGVTFIVLLPFLLFGGLITLVLAGALGIVGAVVGVLVTIGLLFLRSLVVSIALAAVVVLVAAFGAIGLLLGALVGAGVAGWWRRRRPEFEHTTTPRS